MIPAPRDAVAADRSFLEAMLAEAAAWRAGVHAPVADVIAPEAIAKYIAGWPRHGDVGVIVDDHGAAWWRWFTAAEAAYGHVSDDAPEIGMGVVPDKRGHGIGTLLLAALTARADDMGLRGLSLSVELDNPALLLYRRSGFVDVATVGNALTMVRWRGDR